MAKALDAYKAVQHELDKHASPTFEPEQFNHFFNSGMEEYFAENYARYDVLQKDVDDVRSVVKTTNPPLTLTDKKVALPADYRHVLRVHVLGKFTQKVGRFALDEEFLFKRVERRLSDEQGYREENFYLRASHRSPYYELEEGNIIVDIGPKVTPLTVTIQYIKTLPVIYLSPNPADDLNQEANNTTIPFPTHVYYELVKKCADLFIENIESQRLAGRLQLKQMRAE